MHSRRSFLRTVGATTAVGAVTAGCLDGVGSTRDADRYWDRLVGPGIVPGDTTAIDDKYEFQFVEAAALVPRDGPLPTPLRSDLLSYYHRSYGSLGVDPESIDALLAGGDYRVSMGAIDANAVESTLEMRGFSVADEHGGYAILVDESDRRGGPSATVAVRDDELVRDFGGHGVDGVVPIIDAIDDADDRYAETVDGVDRLLTELGSGSIVRGYGEGRSLRAPLDGKQAGGVARLIESETTTDRTAYVFETESAANAAVVDWFEEHEVFADTESLSTEIDGRVVVAEAKRRTSDLDRIVPPRLLS